MRTQPHLWTVRQSATAVADRTCSAEELMAWTRERIERHNHSLRAFVRLSETAMDEARATDRRLAAGEPIGPLAGVPVAVKDLMDTREIETTYGGVHYAGHVPAADATVVAKLRQAGAIVIGKTNLHEYAYGTTGENPHYGNCVNPWNRSRISGGSSSGCSVALSAGLCAAAVGTDSGGSIRIPASLTGHPALKPTYGRVSRAGIFALAPSLDHVGPMARTVSDLSLLLACIAGPDPADDLSAHVPVRADTLPEAALSARIGIPRRFFFDRCHPGVLAAVLGAIKQAEQGLPGWRFEEVEVPRIDDVPKWQNVIMAAEARAVHERLLRNQADLYGEDVRLRLLAGEQAAGWEYRIAQESRTQWQKQLRSLFHGRDALLTPTTPITASEIGQSKIPLRMVEVNVRSHLTRCTNPWNLSGFPALSVPCGCANDGLPVALQLVGLPFTEAKLLRLATALEEVFQWNPVAPDFRAP